MSSTGSHCGHVNMSKALSGITTAGHKMLSVFALDIGREWTGADLARETGLLRATLYQLLIRYVQRGWLLGRWEAATPESVGRPIKHFYRVTRRGVAALTAAATETDLGLS